MGIRSSLTLAAAVFAMAPGCITVHTDADGKVKSVDMKAGTPAGKADAPVVDPQVKPASATVPAVPVAAASAAGLTKYVPKLGNLAAGPPPAEMAVTWQNKLAQLPDPTKNGAFGTGLVGQLFMYGSGPKMPFAAADGKLTIELFDESRPGAEPTRLGSWTLEKEVLKKLVTHDERFGKCYALFLPWPTYRPDVTRVRLTTKFDPESGAFPLYSDPTTMTLDTTVGGERPTVTRQTVPAAGPVVMPANPSPPGAGSFAPPIPLYAPTPTQHGGGPAAPAGPTTVGGVPAGLPPIATVLTPR